MEYVNYNKDGFRKNLKIILRCVQQGGMTSCAVCDNAEWNPALCATTRNEILPWVRQRRMKSPTVCDNTEWNLKHQVFILRCLRLRGMKSSSVCDKRRRTSIAVCDSMGWNSCAVCDSREWVKMVQLLNVLVTKRTLHYVLVQIVLVSKRAIGLKMPFSQRNVFITC